MKTLLTLIALTVTMLASGQAEAAQCKVELVNGRGRLVDTFRAYGYNRHEACIEAKQDCRRAVRAGYYRARVLNCNVVQQRRMVTRSCGASLIGPRGRTIQTFLATAQGLQGTGVKGDACRKAKRKCNNFKQRTGRYRATCISDRNGGVYTPAPMPRPRPMPRRIRVLDA